MNYIKVGKKRIAVVDLRTPSETLYAFAEVERGRTCWLWVIRCCPFCGKSHSHGGGNLLDDPRSSLGSRVPHCAAGYAGMYELTDNPARHGQPVEVTT